ncbi:Proteasome activator complex subunit 4 [Labeo rohita]|uniref:Proteasome activator complex subunit 4 n=1 Tax=Labeo rohita TaxID=84645 RepID=A0ABQ8MST3_LABRO|nr:Proteasome activator complex subunit 4 [Labeo rohita]
MVESASEPPASASSMEDVLLSSSMEGVLTELRRSSKYSFHRPTMSPVEVSRFPPPLYTVLVGHCFPLLRRRTVCQNLFEADR